MFKTAIFGGERGICSFCIQTWSSAPRRSISTNTAISRGIRRSSAAIEGYRRRKPRDTTGDPTPPFSSFEESEEGDLKFLKTHKATYGRKGRARELQDSFETRPRGRSQANYSREDDREDGRKDIRQSSEASSKKSRGSKQWIQIPYTTAASVFLYGTSAVTAALNARRRKLYTLYLHSRAQKTGHKSDAADIVRKYATQAGVNIKVVDDSWLPEMDRKSGGRPHNGLILEASPLPNQWVTSLSSSSVAEGYFEMSVGHQSKEDLEINGQDPRINYDSNQWRHPFVLFLDSILDEGNFGAIIRSAYYLGVDAIVTPQRASAPLSAVALKASAGAAEVLPLLRTMNAAPFIQASKREGWKVYTAHVPKSAHKIEELRKSGFGASIVYTKSGRQTPQLDHHALSKHPAILVLGGEGFGVRNELLRQSDYHVSLIPGRNIGDAALDSLNVSVAAGTLCGEFMKAPAKAKASADERSSELLF